MPYSITVHKQNVLGAIHLYIGQDRINNKGFIKLNTQDKIINEIVKENDEHMKKWLKQLCDTEERLEDFVNDYLDTKRLWDSLCTFQVHSKIAGRGRAITQEELQECIDRNDDTLLKLLLEDSLLIPVSDKALKVFKQQANLKNFILCLREYSETAIITFTGDSIAIVRLMK